jgi:hypothetical protein
MTPQEFIQKRLADLHNSPKVLPEGDMAEQIFRLLVSKKFRKYAQGPGGQECIKGLVEGCVRSGKPIKVLWPFGGYKLWRLEESPLPDWAELFSLLYLARWLKPIADSYAPGVELVFSTDEMIVERINNIPKSDTRSYEDAFLMLLDFLRPWLPENFNMSLVPMRMHYEGKDFEAALAAQIESDKKKYENGLPKLSEAQVKSIEMNVRLNPGQADDSLWREKNALVHDAYINLTDPYLYEPDTIGAFSVPIGMPNFLAVGTTKTSIVRFWVGAGVLQRKGDAYIENVFSCTQLERAEFDWTPVSIDGLSGKNFTKIRVIGGAKSAPEW